MQPLKVLIMFPILESWKKILSIFQEHSTELRLMRVHRAQGKVSARGQWQEVCQVVGACGRMQSVIANGHRLGGKRKAIRSPVATAEMLHIINEQEFDWF